jgi:predicted  nucleic acid-binding Zn-ribbon protein
MARYLCGSCGLIFSSSGEVKACPHCKGLRIQISSSDSALPSDRQRSIFKMLHPIQAPTQLRSRV